MVVGAAAEEEIDPHRELTGIIDAPERFVDRHEIAAGGGRRSGGNHHVSGPGRPWMALPPPPCVSSPDELAREIAEDLGGAPDVPPVDTDRHTVSPLVPP
jgi:hypothetical protein